MLTCGNANSMSTWGNVNSFMITYGNVNSLFTCGNVNSLCLHVEMPTPLLKC